MTAISVSQISVTDLADPGNLTLTVAQARAVVRGWHDITDKQRTEDLQALTAVAEFGRSYPALCNGILPEDLPLGCALLNRLLYAGPPRCAGFEPERFKEVVSTLRGVLRRLGLHAPYLVGASRLSPSWRTLHDALPTRYRRLPLIGFFRFCSTGNIAPEAVAQETLVAYDQWCRERTIDGNIARTVRGTAANWAWARDNVEGWPRGELVSPQLKELYTLPLEAYPASFQADVKAYADRLAGADDTFTFLADSESFREDRPVLKPRSIATRLSQIRFAAAALVCGGMDPAEIRSLRDLVEPVERARAILAFHLERLRNRRAERGEDFNPRDPGSSHVIGIAETLRQIAKHHCRLDEELVERIVDLNDRVSGKKHRVRGQKRQVTMTTRNRERLRRLIEPRTRAMLLHLSRHWMRKAANPETPREEAARLALYAVALEILLVCPLRRQNLGELAILSSFHRDRGGRGRITRLRTSPSKIKNGVEVDWPLPADSVALIETYLTKYRPVLLEDAANPWLFPGKGQRHRNIHELGVALSERVSAEIGVEVNTHLFRHFAVWNFLTDNPGQYEIVRQVLGHKKVETTIAYYAGLEADASARHFSDTVLRGRERTRSMANAAFRGRRGRTRPRSAKA